MMCNTNTCGDCLYFTGEECNGFINEGSEVYEHTPACDDYVPTDEGK